MHPLNVSEQLTRWIDGAGNQSFILNISVPCPLSIRSSVSLSVCQSVTMSNSMSVCQSLCVPVSRSVRLSARQSIFQTTFWLSIRLKVSELFQCFYQSLCEFVTVFSQSATFCQSVYQYVNLTVRQSVCQYVCLPMSRSFIHPLGCYHYFLSFSCDIFLFYRSYTLPQDFHLIIWALVTLEVILVTTDIFATDCLEGKVMV